MRKNKAFTLIEILIVVILLGILAAVVVPQFSDVSSQAQDNANATVEKAIRSQLELYRADPNMGNGGYPDALADLVTAGLIDEAPTNATYTATDSDSDTVNDSYTLTVTGSAS